MAVSASRILLYGSCVSRDMLEFLDVRHTMVAYIARQSFISATSPAADPASGLVLNSAFQERMVRDDFRSTALPVIEAQAPSLDALILDLVDERLGVVQLHDGEYVTRSLELLSSGLLDRTPGVSGEIELGTDRHFELWRAAAMQVVDLLRRTGVLNKTLVIDAPFASMSDTGAPVPMWKQQRAECWNDRYQRYYAVLRQAGLRVHAVGDLAIASEGHRWGLAPYHYADAAYLAVAETVRSILSECD